MVSLSDNIIEMSNSINNLEESKRSFKDYGSLINETRVRATTDLQVFREKIMLFENGFDDRLAEIQKLVATMNMYKLSDKCGWLTGAIYDISGGKMKFAMKRIGKKKDIFAELLVEAYEDIKKKYGERIADKDSYLVNAVWAIDIIRDSLNEKDLEIYEKSLMLECEELWTYEDYISKLKNNILNKDDNDILVHFLQIFASMPVALPVSKKEDKEAILLVEASNGDSFIPIFISANTLESSRFKYDGVINLSVVDILPLMEGTGAKGIMLEPFNEPFVFSKEMLEAMKKRVSTKKKRSK